MARKKERFQSLIGRLQTQIRELGLDFPIAFQSLIGRLQTPIDQEPVPDLVLVSIPHR